MNIRKFVISADSLDELVRLGTMTAQAADLLEASARWTDGHLTDLLIGGMLPARAAPVEDGEQAGS